ncbi:MAG: HK97 family phage prohead protease [Dinoroseobacter sp.]|nr:HK97 family phage prohead protease [Dinoroseobacter sp.]
MLFAGQHGTLEARQSEGGETRLRGAFPYNRETVLFDGGGRAGQARRETIASRAFSRRVSNPDADIHLLAAHDFDKPLASRGAGTLDVTEDENALRFEARIPAEMARVSWVADVLGALRAGLVRGLSPGFRVQDTSGAEDVRSDASGLLRTVRQADLFEISAVTVPAYQSAQIEARNWDTPSGPPKQISRDVGFNPRSRWRV